MYHVGLGQSFSKLHLVVGPRVQDGSEVLRRLLEDQFVGVALSVFGVDS